MYGGLSLVVSFSTISLYAAATTEWTERDRERHPLKVIEVQVLVGTPVGCLADLEVWQSATWFAGSHFGCLPEQTFSYSTRCGI
jgi:hypothetical protein